MERRDIARLLAAFSTLQVYPKRVFAELAPKAQQYISYGIQRERRERERGQQVWHPSAAAGPTASSVPQQSGGPSRGQQALQAESPAASPFSHQAAAAGPPSATPTYLHADLADLAWAYSQAGYHHSGLFDAIAEQAAGVMPSFDARLLGRLCGGFRQARHHHAALLQGVAGRAMQLAEAGEWRVGVEANRGGSASASVAAVQHISGGISILAYLSKFGHDCRTLLQVSAFVTAEPPCATAGPPCVTAEPPCVICNVLSACCDPSAMARHVLS